VFAIAFATVQDLVRRRVFVVLALFVVAMLMLSFPLRQLTIGQWYRLIVDVGLGGTELGATLAGILLGATVVSGDIDRRTILPILAKPINRATFVGGRFAGLVVVILALTASMTLGTALSLALARQTAFLPLIQASALIACSAILVSAIAVAFSCVASPTLAGLIGITIALAGHLTDNLAYFGAKAHSATERWLLRGLSHGLPNLEMLNVKGAATRALVLPLGDIGVRVTYAAAYTIVVLALGIAAFGRRDLK